ncbi:MAG: aldo/keto reductase [Rhodobacteraceae bacterium]|jgi:aryl-alcohol dehydrogenase-like predicted oxidoreductase|uniref:Putative oxidoreductase, aryl-alcohol dehydrogenase like protein n=1 Tax=Salipiger profundus TaxID=1229727 RepID=A0A1U7DCM7_9RHOB|nr:MULTISPECIES: aldo/keto reductase [Salipiger]APX25914.1 putative oxidoreductase, aryl-alcohol dehydrogenase like protein [Salipiger profundus]MAB05063.1 aldo/keto reductase [Paracoccaceae bacterium]SFC82569.1 Predicted oxidoreductase [Salipiger profundus]
MRYNTLGRSGLKVSAIAMGTFTFGGEGNFAMVGNQGVDEARSLFDCALDHGVNLIDTANMYSTGTAEEIVGEALAGRRDRVLISSKARMAIGDGPNDEGASRWHLIRECERSLKRLRTDHIDIYHIHEWDGQTPVEETMEALHTLQQQGKIRYAGCSNYTAWQLMKSLMASEKPGRARFVTQQIHYTLEAREAEYELLPASVDQGVGVTVWSPLAAGLLSGKHTRDTPVAPDSRQARGWTEPPIRDQERLWRIVDVLNDIAAVHEVEAAQIALAWLLTRPAVASLVVGGSSVAQFERNFRALDVVLSEAELQRLDEVSRPPLIYPLWHQAQFASPRYGAADGILGS